MVREAKQQGNINQGEEVMAQNLKISLASRTMASMRLMACWHRWKPRVMSCVRASISRSSRFLTSSSSKPGSTCFWCSWSSLRVCLAIWARCSVISSCTSSQRGGSRSISMTASPSSWYAPADMSPWRSSDMRRPSPKPLDVGPP
jgi:hypothetical protein